MLKALVSAIAICSLLCGGAAAATNSAKGKMPTKAMPTKKANPTEILATQLVLNAYKSGDSLSEACRRANFKNLALALGMNVDLLTREKGEFETSQQYAERSDHLGKVLSDDPIVICLTPSMLTSFSYNADSQRFEGELGESMTVWQDVKQLRPYRSKTRMGISATVKPSLVMEYEAALSFPSYPYGCLSGDHQHKFSLPYSRDNAPLLKTIGQIVLLAKLEPPYVEKEDIPGNPTLDNPYDIYTHRITVHIKPEKLTVADYKGNDVWTCKVGALSPFQVPTPQGSAAGWISIIDYPVNGYREKLAGTVRAVLHIGANGSVSDCRVVQSSGSNELVV